MTSSTISIFLGREDPDEALKLILELVKCRIPNKFGFDPIDDIQVLTPMHKGSIGAGNLNTELQAALNPTGREMTRGGRSFRVNAEVMQIKNNYDKEVFNGDIGRILRIDQETQQITNLFDGRKVDYGFTDLDEVVLVCAAENEVELNMAARTFRMQ